MRLLQTQRRSFEIRFVLVLKLDSFGLMSCLVVRVLVAIYADTYFTLINFLEVIQKLWPLLPSIRLPHMLINSAHDFVHLLLILLL